MSSMSIQLSVWRPNTCPTGSNHSVNGMFVSLFVSLFVLSRYPGATGGQAVAETLFGVSNRFGKLPFTYYAYNFTQLVRGAHVVSTACV